MKKLVLMLMVCVPLLAFAQQRELRHELDVYAGYAWRDSVSGVALQIQYAFGPDPHIDLLAATSFGTGTRQSWDVRFPKYTLGVTSIGVRIHSNIDKPVSVGLSLLAGVDWDLLYEKISPTLSKRTLYLHGSLDGKLQVNFLLNPQTSLGVFYDYSFKYPFSRAVSVSDLPNIHTAGIVFGYKFKRKTE
ncbi:MAG: hypothetical protein J6S87_04115 [Bacteroidales bacterium]|nr:hypothetical protein [Bacteroidales bacterium]